MKIHKQEIIDGLEEALASSNTIAYCSVAEAFSPNEEQIKVAKALDNGNEGQIDLFYLKSILVSTGWNKNDDVFDPSELWAARNTPEDKPFNFMHNEKDIIGHITGNTVIDFDGNEINQDMPEVPSEFNILTTSVIYTSWSDIEQRARMDKIVAEIEEGKWFVSMECLFPDFDYALVNSDGSASVIKRTEASAFLTKHLRAYGGNGNYQNYKVGRLLRNLSFSGKGLVSKPANPRSVILDGNEFFDESKASALDINFINEETTNMSDELNQQIADLQKDLADAKAANETLNTSIAETAAETEVKTTEAAEALAVSEAKVAELTEAMKNGEDDMSKKNEEIKAMKDKMAKMEEELAGYKKQAMQMKRKAELVEVGLAEDVAAETAADFADADDETFGRVIATLAKTVKVEAKVETPAEEKMEEVVAEETVQLDEEVDSSEASEADLDTVEETAEVTVAEAAVDSEGESLRSIASDWLGSVLRSTNKNN